MLGCASGGRNGASAIPLDATDIRLYGRILEMADARRPDDALLDSALARRTVPLRAAATLAAGQLRDTSLLPRLRGLLADRDTAVAANAAFALGLARDGSAVADLARAASQSSGAVGYEAAWALGEIGAPAREVIVAALSPAASRRAAPHALPALLVAAGKLRPVPVSAIAPYLDATESGVARAAAYALGRSRAPGGVRALVAHAGSRDAETREHVARGIAKGAAGDSLADSALAALRQLARDASAHVRVNALRSLGTYGPRARAPLVAATRDPDANVRIAAAQSLANVLPAVPRDWRALWDADTGFMYRRSLVTSAVTTGVILHAIDEDNPDNWQRTVDWRYRAAVAEAGAAAPQIERVVEVTLPMTRDHDGRVRAAAYATFAPWVDSSGTDRHPWRRSFLLPALKDEDVSVRASVLAALANHPRTSELPAVLDSYRRAGGDTLNDARVAAIRYLAAAWRLDSASFPDSVRRLIAALPTPADPLERAGARGSSLFGAWRAPSQAPRPLAWYEDAVREYVLPALRGTSVHADIVTERGTITLELFGVDAPLTVRNFLSLARSGVFRETRFHRVVPNFVAQDGDPRGDGNGGPGYAIRDELNRRRYDRGAVGMALSGPDTGGSQYFLTLSRQPHLDGHYTVFARVVAGEEVMDRLVQGDRIVEVRRR